MRIVFFLGFSLALAFVAAGIMGSAEQAMAQRQSFGSASVVVEAPPNVDDVAWVLDLTDSSKVRSVEVSFAEDIPATIPEEDYFVCVQVTNGTLPPLANGCVTLSSTTTLSAGTPVTVGFDSSPNETASAADITSVSVTVTAPVAAVSAPNGVQVTDVDWDLLADLDGDTTTVDQVVVTFAPTTSATSVTVRLTLKDPVGRILLRETLDHDLSITGSTLTWTLSSAVSAQAIARLDVKVDRN